MDLTRDAFEQHCSDLGSRSPKAAKPVTEDKKVAGMALKDGTSWYDVEILRVPLVSGHAGFYGKDSMLVPGKIGLLSNGEKVSIHASFR